MLLFENAGHVLQLRAQIEKYATTLKVPVPNDPYASKHLPVPTEYQHGLPSANGQSSQASQLAARLSSLVNEIATTTNRAAIAVMNREAEGVMSRLREYFKRRESVQSRIWKAL